MLDSIRYTDYVNQDVWILSLLLHLMDVNRELTCRLIRGISSQETTVGHRSISAEHNGHGVAGRANLGAGWYCTTESL